MTTPKQSTRSTAVYPAQDRRLRSIAPKAGRFIRHLLEMLLAMETGMLLFHLLVSLIPASSSYASLFASGTDLHAIAMVVFMTLPMVAWMIVRGHGWRHSAEMMVAMLAPMATVALLCQVGLDVYLPWLPQASGPAMFLGMLAAMLYRLDHYTGSANHLTHTAHLGDSSQHVP